MPEGTKTAARGAALRHDNTSTTRGYERVVQEAGDDVIAEFVRRTTTACGVPELVDDVAVLDTVARLVRR